MNQTEEDYLIYDADDEAIKNWLENNTTKAKLVPFSLTKPLDFGAFLEENNININTTKEHFCYANKSIIIRRKTQR